MRFLWILLAVAAITSRAFSAPPGPPIYKGMTISCQTWGIEWQTPEMEASIDELKSLGVNSIAIHPYLSLIHI